MMWRLRRRGIGVGGGRACGCGIGLCVLSEAQKLSPPGAGLPSAPQTADKMAKLRTQPAQAKVTSLRSGFYCLPLANDVHLYARLHHGQDLDEPSTSAPPSTNSLFITSLPLGASNKSITKLVSAVYPDLSVRRVELLAPTGSVDSLLARELITAAVDGSKISPLFETEHALKGDFKVPSRSCIVEFDGTPALPPPAYSSALGFPLALATSALAASLARHALARPHPSSITAHADSWMQQFDQRKIATVDASRPTPLAAAAAVMSKTAAKKLARQKLKEPAAPLPGSAGHALALHAAAQAKAKDRSVNPDEVDEEGWTLVTGGGKHGKSVLPEGVLANVGGYGGVSVKVAGKTGKGSQAEADAGIKQIVGDGFYRFKKEEGRRAGTCPSVLPAPAKERGSRVGPAAAFQADPRHFVVAQSCSSWLAGSKRTGRKRRGSGSEPRAAARQTGAGAREARAGGARSTGGAVAGAGGGDRRGAEPPGEGGERRGEGGERRRARGKGGRTSHIDLVYENHAWGLLSMGCVHGRGDRL